MPRRKRTTAMQIRELRPGDRVYVSLRDSGGAGQERSVAEQRSEVERYCAERGLVIAGEFVDEATQSGNYARRVGFLAMIEACKGQPRPVEGVVTSSTSRWGRDEYDSAFYRTHLRRLGVQVVSVSSTAPVGPWMALLETLEDTQNRMFLDNMSYEVRKGLRRNVAAGYAPGGSAPTGYVAVREQIGTKRDGTPRYAPRWVVDENLGPKITQAFSLAADGWTFQRILDATGLPMSRGTLRSVLRNRSYLGLYKLGAEEFPGPEALVDEDTFERVQARFTTRAAQAGRAKRMKTTAFILTGLAVCGGCGTLMESSTDRRAVYGGKTPRPWRSYRCRRCEVGRVSAQVLEANVVQRLLDDVINEAALGAMLARLRELLDDPSTAEDLAELGRQIAGKRRSIDTLLDAIEAGGGAATQERLNQREAELAQLEARRREIEGRANMARTELTREMLAELVAEMRRQVTSEDAAEAKHALRQWLERVLVWDADRFEPVYAGVGNQTVPPRGFSMIPLGITKLPLASIRRM